MKFKTTLEQAHSLIDLTPLVDVVFLMLIFFMITSDILPLKSLNVENPPLELTAPALTTQVLVVMDAQNVIYVGSKKEIVDLASFKDSLEKEIQKSRRSHPGAEISVVLSIDRRVEYDAFLPLLSSAQTVGTKLRLAYSDPTEENLCCDTPAQAQSSISP